MLVASPRKKPDRRNCNLRDGQLPPIKLIQLAWPPPNHWITAGSTSPSLDDPHLLQKVPETLRNDGDLWHPTRFAA